MFILCPPDLFSPSEGAASPGYAFFLTKICIPLVQWLIDGGVCRVVMKTNNRIQPKT